MAVRAIGSSQALIRLTGEWLGGDQAGRQKQLGAIRKAGRQASSWEPAVLDCERDVQLPGHPSRGPRLERVQAGLRDTHPLCTNFLTGPLVIYKIWSLC